MIIEEEIIHLGSRSILHNSLREKCHYNAKVIFRNRRQARGIFSIIFCPDFFVSFFAEVTLNVLYGTEWCTLGGQAMAYSAFCGYVHIGADINGMETVMLYHLKVWLGEGTPS